MVHIKRVTMQGFKSFAKKTDILFDKGINVILGPNGAGKSCSYDTIVTLSDGRETELGKLVEEQVEKSEVIKKLDDGVYVDGDGSLKVISLNKNTMKSEIKEISKFIKREGEIIYKIKTASGRELKATGCHPVMIFKDGEIRSTLIRDLDKGKLIAVPRIVKIESDKNDEELSRLIGYIIGDGYVAKDRIEFVNNDTEVIEDYKQLLKKFSLGDMRERFDKNINRIYIREKAFVSKIKNFFYKDYEGSITSEIKQIPEYFMTLDNKSTANLLSGLFDTDGSVRKDVGIIEYCTKNESLARQVQFLLLRFGITSKVKMRKCRACNTIEKIERNYYYVYIYGRDNLKRFYENIKLRVEHKRMNLETHLARNIIPNPNIDILPQEVNLHIKELARLLGIKIKNARAEYPSLAAYTENRCAPTRAGINTALGLFSEKLSSLVLSYENILPNQLNLVGFMDQLNIAGKEVSQAIGLHETIIRNQWATEKFNARPVNLQKFQQFITNAFRERLIKINGLMALLKNLASSDIFWDRIVSIEKLEKELYVYDLTIKENHNFIANNIFAHNSNISDALCFALGRLSIKSMRAAKAKNLLFMGSKFIKPAHEAAVELAFDNSGRAFALNKEEVVIKRIVRRNGQSIYKINDETKTRGEVQELLHQAGIDPYGFNMVLQGNIQNIIKMRPEDRRKIIEDVAGISIYEFSKQKSIHDLEKTEERLKEIITVLREKTNYLKNLEGERANALKYKELELSVKRCKASILNKKIEEKKKEISSIVKSIEQNSSQKDKANSSAEKIKMEIAQLAEKIEQINKHIEKATGLEQETLHNQIADLKADIEGDKVRKESYENRREEIKRRIEQINKNIPELLKEIEALKKESPIVEEKSCELKKKKEELALIEDKKRGLLTAKTELASLRERIKDRQAQLSRIVYDSDSILKLIEKDSENLVYKNDKECSKGISSLRNNVKSLKEEIKNLEENEIKNQKLISVSESVIAKAEQIKENIKKLDICPLCQSKMSAEHVSHVTKNSESDIIKAREELRGFERELEKIKSEKANYFDKVKSFEEKVSLGDVELIRHNSIKERNEQLKKLVENEKFLKDEIGALELKRREIENRGIDLTRIEEEYHKKMLEIEEISSRTKADTSYVLSQKERDIEGMQNIIKTEVNNLTEIGENVLELSNSLDKKEAQLDMKEHQERELSERFKKMFSDREKLQKSVNENSINLSEIQSNARAIDEQVNYLKIGKAQNDASCGALQMEISEYSGVELISGSFENLQERLQKAQTILAQIGNINQRALEVYDEVKKGYDEVQGRVNTIEKEKLDIQAIIQEIDNKKRREFMKTFRAINEIFTENFSKLYTKGIAFLELENKEDIFSGGVNIVVKLAKGKLFDVTSLSGGEQTLVALALLFAIQEHKPYHFYVFDEIDAALDKRNSERLAALLKQYIGAGQYIIVTHNDSIITESDFLYGVSMQDGVSKVLSLKLNAGAEEKAVEEGSKIEVPTQENIPTHLPD